MSKLGLDIGENHCVIRFKAMYPPTNDTGTFVKPVWWCTKDSDGYFNIPEQVYVIFAYQKISGYFLSNSNINIYNSYLSSGSTIYPLGTNNYIATTVTNSAMRGSSMLWIDQISKFKPNFYAGSAGTTYDFWIIVIPL